jgi:5-methylcytosine-specific restriction endonuclease McrA
MPWDTSNRRQSLPPDWGRIRGRIMRRDRSCQLRYDGCGTIATEVDHIGAPEDHRDVMLRAVCHACHVKRTAQQAADAQPRARRAPPERHPGLRW